MISESKVNGFNQMMGGMPNASGPCRKVSLEA